MVVGMTQMRKRNVVVRQLSALEALGGVTNICSDKTGTLTQGQMVTRKAWIPGVGIYSVNNSDDATNPTRGTVSLGTAPASKSEAEKEQKERRAEKDLQRSTVGLKFDVPAEKAERDQRKAEDSRNGKVAEDEESEAPPMIPELESFLHSAALCNLATVRLDGEEWHTIGDPTEIALQVFAHRFGHGKKTLERDQGWTQLTEFPFDSDVKRMSVVYKHESEEAPLIFTKGAVERVIDLCTTVGIGGHREEMTQEKKEQILEQMTLLADQGLRVLAVARRTAHAHEEFYEHSETPRESIENDLTLLGLAGLYDPPRLETKDAVKGMY